MKIQDLKNDVNGFIEMMADIGSRVLTYIVTVGIKTYTVSDSICT